MHKKLTLSLAIICSSTFNTNASERVLVALESGGVVQLCAKKGTILNRFETGKDAFGVIYDQKGEKGYVTDKSEGTLVIIDTLKGSIDSKLNLGKLPQQPALTNDGHLFVPMSGEGAVAEVELAGTPRLEQKLNLGIGSKPHIVSLSPDKKTLWVTVQGMDPRVVSIDLNNEYQMKDYRYDIVPRVIAGYQDGAYFTGHHSTGLHQIDLASGAVTTPLMDNFGSASAPNKQIEGIATSTDGSIYAVTHEGKKSLIAVVKGKKCQIGNLADKPYWVSLGENSTVAYVSIPGAALVEAYDIVNCQERPLWSTTVGGKAKRMDVF